MTDLKAALEPGDVERLDNMLERLVFHHAASGMDFAAVARVKSILAALSTPSNNPSPSSSGEREDGIRGMLAAAYEQGCIDTHRSIQAEPELALMPIEDAEFGEAADDYASFALLPPRPDVSELVKRVCTNADEPNRQWTTLDGEFGGSGVMVAAEDLRALRSALERLAGPGVEEIAGPDLKITGIADEEDGPAEALLFDLPNGDQVWSGEIARATFDELDAEDREALGNDFGPFVVHASKTDGLRVLARAVDKYAAMDLAHAYARFIAPSSPLPSSISTGGEKEHDHQSPSVEEKLAEAIEPFEWRLGEGGYLGVATLYEVSDYDGGDPALEIGHRRDGTFDLVITKGGDDITLWKISPLFVDKIGQLLRRAAAAVGDAGE